MKILVTNIFKRKTFDLVNILKENNYGNNIIFCTENKSLINSIRFFLSYGKGILEKLNNDDTSYIEDLKKISKKYKNEKIVFIPIEESSTLNFYKFLKNGKKTSCIFYQKKKHLSYLGIKENYLISVKK